MSEETSLTMPRTLQSDSRSVGVLSPSSAALRPDRPCDMCRKGKRRCVIDPEHQTTCVLCAFHHQTCTFLEEPTPRKRKAPPLLEVNDREPTRLKRGSDGQTSLPHSEPSIRDHVTIEDYADLQSPSLLKKTLGLQNHRHARYIGPTDVQDSTVLGLRQYSNIRNESIDNAGSFRQVSSHLYFHQSSDTERPDHARDVADVDEVERTVAPYGFALIRLYFRIIHPTFPILHKKVFLEKYGRSHREFSPPLLAAVYLLALNWWQYSSELSGRIKPDVSNLEDVALQALWRISRRAKLSTVQAALLLSQHAGVSCWSLTSLLVSVAQDVGLHQDCSGWRIPVWERGLRKRLAWAVFMQDTWAALAYGRPPHLSLSNWGSQPVASNDFPENAADEDDEEGSTEVEKGRTLFSAMIALTRILSGIMEDMYSLKAEAEINSAVSKIDAVLARAKPRQLELRSWYAQMPESLRLDSHTKIGKLNSVGCLHLAYHATEMTIHRKVLHSLSDKVDPYLIQLCRTAAKSRLTHAINFFEQLKPEHLASFWYFTPDYNFAMIGTFAGLCWATSTTLEEVGDYQEQLQRYRWTIRVRGNSVDFFKQVSDLIASAVEPLIALSKKTSPRQNRQSSIPFVQNEIEEADNEDLDTEFTAGFDYASISQFFLSPLGTDMFSGGCT